MGESTNPRQSRLRLLARQNRGRTEYKTYFADLTLLLKTDLADSDKLDLVETDRLFAAHVKLYQESKRHPQCYFQKTRTYEPAIAWSRVSAEAGRALHGSEGILFIGPFEYCGAIKVDVA